MHAWARILVQVTIYRRLLIEMAISTNQKPTICRNLYENTGPGGGLSTCDCPGTSAYLPAVGEGGAGLRH